MSKDPEKPIHLIYIPTHRSCSTVIDEQIQEAVWLRERGEEPLLCVIDNAADDFPTHENQSFLHERTPTGLRAAYLTKADQLRLISDLSGRLTSSDLQGQFSLSELLLPSGLSYGRGPNLAAVMGAALGCAAIHRRDSDEYRDSSRLMSFPIEMEVAALGRSLGQITPKPRGDISNKLPVALVGTSMFGRPPLDRRDLFAAGQDFALRLQKLGRPGVPDDQVRSEAEDYLITEPNIRHPDDFFDAEAPARVEMGMSATSYGLFRLLPEMPGAVIGTDYMQRDLASELDMPILFHSRKVQHVYGLARQQGSDLQAAVDYAIRDMQYIQMGRIWQKHSLQIHTDAYFIGKSDQDFDRWAYANSFLAAAELSAEVLQTVRLSAYSIYRQASEATSGELATRLAAAADEIERRGDAIDEDVVFNVRRFAALVKLWPKIISAAPKLRQNVDSLFS